MSPTNAPWLLFRAAAKTTARGAAITLTSTVVSCALACYIERGAHQLVYHYFPHKYANVEYANGLTQDQLDAVRIYRTPISTTAEAANTPTLEEKDWIRNASEASTESTSLSTAMVSQENTETSWDETSATVNSYWREETRRETSPVFAWRPQESFRSTEILACAMTG